MADRAARQDEELITARIGNCLVEELRTLLGLSEINGRPVQPRAYQVDASVECVEHLLAGQNAIVDLPTGTGKTMIANMVTYLWQRTRPESRVLYIVPRRVLVGQHHRHARWLAGQFPSLAIDSSTTANDGRYNALLRIFPIYISTPQLFANSLRNRITDPEFVSTIGLVIVDEFDEFLQFEYRQRGTGARFKRDFRSLFDLLDPTTAYLLMSATSPLKALSQGSMDGAVYTFSQFVVNRFQPYVIKVDQQAYEDFIPTASVRAVSVMDWDVTVMSQAVRHQIGRAFLDYRCETGVELDATYLFPRLNDILFGRIRLVRTAGHGWIAADFSVKKLCRRLLSIIHKYNFLFEDMFAGIGWEYAWKRVVCEYELEMETDRPKFKLLPVLVGEGDGSEGYTARLHAKFDCVRRIVEHRRTQRGVIFTRYIRLSDALSERLTEMGIPHCLLDSRARKSKELDSRLADFASGRVRLLVMTRKTGQRGLDLPQADYAIFYSPKASELTVWQELSRIRSTIHSTKESYFLVYRTSREEEKMQDLVSQMQASGREYEIHHHRAEELGRHLAKVGTTV